MRNKIIFLFLLLPAMVLGQVQIRLPDTTVMAGTTVNIPVYIDSSLTGLGVYSFQFQISYNASRLNPTGLIKTGTISQQWGNVLFSQQPGIFNFLGAGITPLGGKGTLVYITCETMNTSGTSISFTGEANNFFNEGSPFIDFINGYVHKTAPPSISVSPNTAEIVKGETLQFSVSGDETAPFAWGVTNPGICSINNDGLLTALGYGPTRVYCTDAVGLTDTTDIIEIRAVKVTLPEMTGLPQQIASIPMNITNTDDLNLISGEIKFTFNENILTPIDFTVEGTLLENDGQVFMGQTTGEVEITFARTIPLEGQGVLIYVNFLAANISSGSTNLNYSKAVFNEDILAKADNGNFSVNYPELSFNPNSASLIAGDQIEITAAGGTQPYTWELTDPSVGNIISTGGQEAVFTVFQGGTTKIKITDAIGIETYSGDFKVTDIRVSIGSMPLIIDSVALIPVLITAPPSGREIYSLEMEMECEANELEFYNVVSTESQTEGWEILFEVNDNNLTVIGAGMTAADDTGTLFFLEIYGTPNLSNGENAWVHFESCTFNEGIPSADTVDGWVTGVETVHAIILPAGWSGLSSWNIPVDQNIENMFGSIESALVILQNLDGFYFPEQNTNTLGNWNSHKGYQIKLGSEAELKIYGARQTSTTIQLTAGWNLIPVLSECEVNVETFFEGLDVEIVKDAVGTGMYWPVYGINTLETFQPGKAYLVKMGSSGEVEFLPCD